MKANKSSIIIIILMILSGCLGQTPNLEDSSSSEEYVLVTEGNDNHSYQFWNLAPMSVGNMSSINVSEGGGIVNISLELSAFFHEPNLWDAGFVNYTITHGNETVFSTTMNHNKTMYTINLTNITTNLTVEIQSTGSDDKSTLEPGDFFIASAKYEVYYILMVE
mgnify:FL=1